MGLELAEGAVTALTTYLSTNFAARVAALNAEYADAVVLTTPAKFAIGELLEADAFPIVVTLCRRTSIRGIGAGYVGTTHHISVVCEVMDDSDVGEEKVNLAKRTYRYARAVIELLRLAQTGGLPGYGVQFPTELIDFSRMGRNRNTSQPMMGCAVSVDLQVQEAG